MFHAIHSEGEMQMYSYWIQHNNKTTPNRLASRGGRQSGKSGRKRRATTESARLHTSNTSHLAWPVMEACRTEKILVPTLRSASISHMFIFLLLLLSAENVNSKRRSPCDVDKCGDFYRLISDSDDLAKKCRQLSLHRDCLKRMQNACRGNLLYHTSVHINEMNLDESNCSTVLEDDASFSKSRSRERTANQCIYAGKPKFRFCSVFGDPHVRTFSDKFYTCKANGSWRLISNDYLVVRATNSLMLERMQASAITKLVVIVRGSGACAKKKTYRAEVGKELPSEFDDGTSHTGPEKSVNISTIEAGKEIQIDIRFIATTIVVRNVDSHLTFSIQMPEDIVDNPVDDIAQMCVTGCPRRQRIRLSHEISRLKASPETNIKQGEGYTEQEARRKCRDILLERDDEIGILDRENRSAGRNPRKRHRRRKMDPGVEASAATFKQLSGLMGGGKKELLRSRKGRTRHRSSPPQRAKKKKKKKRNRKWDSGFLRDDPGVGRFGRGGRRARDRAAVSGVERGSNFYFEACVFDLMTTGDVTYATSARGAFDDVTRFHRYGARAKGASKKAVASWTADPTTTSSPPTPKATETTRTTSTMRIRVPHSTTRGNRARHASLDLTLLLICLLSTAYLRSLIFSGEYFENSDSFFNRREPTT